MKTITYLLLFLFAGLAGMAQNKDQVSDAVLKEVEILKKADLNMSPVQLQRVTSVLVGQEQIKERNLKVLQGNKSVQEQKLKELKENKIMNIKGTLTPQQVEKFNALHLEDKFN